jgi:hypothetical protein
MIINISFGMFRDVDAIKRHELCATVLLRSYATSWKVAGAGTGHLIEFYQFT